MSAAYRCSWWLVAVMLLLGAPAEASLNAQYLVPGGSIHIDQQLVAATVPRVCALTFDDGPDGEYTTAVQRVLDHYGIKATFFLVGERIAEHPDVVRKLAATGHEIGNHTYTHPDLTGLSSAAQRRELMRTTDSLASLGINAAWFRPPYGRAGRTALDLAAEMNMDVIRWSVDPRDWSQPGVAAIESRVLRQTCPGAVILLHSTNAQTVAALPGIIDELTARGYIFTTMSAWRALVTGEATLPAPPVPAATNVATELTPVYELDDPFYRAFEAGELPRVVEELEKLTPDDYAHVIWSEVNARAISCSRDNAVTSPAPPPPCTETLTVYANFDRAAGLTGVFRHGGSSSYHVFHSKQHSTSPSAIPPAPTVQAATPDEIPAASTAVTVIDTPVLNAGRLPTLPEGEEMFIAPAAAYNPAPLPLQVVNLFAALMPAGTWTPPAAITAADLITPPVDPAAAQTAADETMMFLRVDSHAGAPAPWTELQQLVELAGLDGLILPTTSIFGNPPAGLDCPWTFAGPSRIKQAAVIPAGDECIPAILTALKQGARRLVITLPASALPPDSSATDELILYRQMTAGLPWTADLSSTAPWELPAGLTGALFSDGSRTTVVLVNHGTEPAALVLPAAYRHYSTVTLESGGRLRLFPTPSATLAPAPGLTVLYYNETVEQP